MMLAVTRGLSCLFHMSHQIGRAADQLRSFSLMLCDSITRTTAFHTGGALSDARTAWQFAKSNRYSVHTHGNLGNGSLRSAGEEKEAMSMALIQVGSFGEFSVVQLEAAMKKLPAARGSTHFPCSRRLQVNCRRKPLILLFLEE